MHANAELADDVIKAIILIASTAAAIFGARGHKQVKEINQAVNGVDDPNAKTICENVEQIHHDAEVIKGAVTAAPPEGQVGG